MVYNFLPNLKQPSIQPFIQQLPHNLQHYYHQLFQQDFNQFLIDVINHSEVHYSFQPQQVCKLTNQIFVDDNMQNNNINTPNTPKILTISSTLTFLGLPSENMQPFSVKFIIDDGVHLV